jgi:hypothetical protein
MCPTKWEFRHEEKGWLFIETVEFTRVWKRYFGADEAYGEYQVHLLKNPLAGDVIPGCGGVRKDRWSDPRRGKGKRGGIRVLYLQIPEVRVILLLDVYGKNETDDLTASQKRAIARLANELKSKLIIRFQKERRR